MQRGLWIGKWHLHAWQTATLWICGLGKTWLVQQFMTGWHFIIFENQLRKTIIKDNLKVIRLHITTVSLHMISMILLAGFSGSFGPRVKTRWALQSPVVMDRVCTGEWDLARWCKWNISLYNPAYIFIYIYIHIIYELMYLGSCEGPPALPSISTSQLICRWWTCSACWFVPSQTNGDSYIWFEGISSPNVLEIQREVHLTCTDNYRHI